MRERLSQDNASVGDEVGKEQRRPRRTRNVPSSGEKLGSDESMESPVEDSDDDKDYKYVEEESSKDEASDDDLPDTNANKKKAKAKAVSE